MKYLPVVIVSACLSGCSGMNYAMKNYDVPSVDFRDEVQRESFQIYDKPGEHRLLITRTVGAAFVQGMFGTAGTMPGPVYEQASISWLAQQGRACRVTRSFLVVEPEWEIQYDCSGPSGQ